MGITAKIWLSIAVFAAGASVAMGVSQVQARLSETRLAGASRVMFPAAQHAQEADAAFQRMAKAFKDAVMIEDAAALDAAAAEGKASADALAAAAALDGLDPARASALQKAQDDVRRTAADGHAAYGAMLAAGGNLTEDVMQRMRRTASAMDVLAKELRDLRAALAADLQGSLAASATSSARQRWVSLVVFVATLLGAGAFVMVTVRRGVVQPVRQIVEELTNSAIRVTAASTSVAASSQSLARDSATQAAALEETAASIQEMASMTRQTASNTADAEKSMQDAARHVAAANAVLGDMVASMEAIRGSSDKVARIIRTIDEIAFQTNILALNASVEAARAGDAGMGFAVVADEVRALAHRCAQAAQDTEVLIEESISRAAEGQARVTSVSHAMASITESADAVKQLVDQVSVASRQQSHGIDQVAKAIAQMETTTQSTAATAEESAASSEQLNAQAAVSQQVVGRLAGLLDGAAQAARAAMPAVSVAPMRNTFTVASRSTSSAAALAEVPPLSDGTYGRF